MNSRVIARVTAVLAISALAVAPVAAAGAAHAATDPGRLTVQELKAIVSSDAVAPTGLGSPVTANLLYAIRKAPPVLACLSADGDGVLMPAGALMVGQGWDYTVGRKPYTVGTTIYQYRSAAKAAEAAEVLRTRDCPDDAAFKDDDSAPAYPAFQASDILPKRHGEPGYAYVYTRRANGGKGYQQYTAIRLVGNAVIASSGGSSYAGLDQLSEWARKAVNSAADAYVAALD